MFSFEPSQRKLKSKKRKEENEGLEKGDGVTQQKQGNRGKEKET